MSRRDGRKTQIRREEEGSNHVPHGNSDSVSQVDSTGQRTLSERVPGTATEGDDHLTQGSLLGGIIAQLIRAEQDKLGEVEGHIATYERERSKVKSRIEELEALKRLEENQRNMNGQ